MHGLVLHVDMKAIAESAVINRNQLNVTCNNKQLELKTYYNVRATMALHVQCN